ncbi:DUF982 domain-containing protein [Arvimicrobium flavum]|uniref:DUF982 domain-containing protein n=1 Tax=Arvimicrobium flavum TaxID=3393320 RepID=UPI00237C41A9|nr:DUF982 domain-containing protein [Mesorhizobium shangrilense]
MTDVWFSRPVLVAVGITGDVQNVLGPKQALELLDHHWRNAGTPAFLNARHACVTAMHGEKPADAAREAFMDAAREARLLAE